MLAGPSFVNPVDAPTTTSPPRYTVSSSASQAFTVAMSVLPPEVHQALGQLLQGLQSPDNVLRAQAESQLNEEWTQSRPDVLLMGLSEQVEGAEDAAVRLHSPRQQPHRYNTRLT